MFVYWTTWADVEPGLGHETERVMFHESLPRSVLTLPLKTKTFRVLKSQKELILVL